MWYQQHHNPSAKFSTINTPLEAARALASLNKLGSYASDAALDQLLEMLDDDQDIPPANRQKRAPPVSADGEVFITPAPYLDHEYSHLQKQLRKPDETHLVDTVNTKLKQERLNHLRSLADANNARPGYNTGVDGHPNRSGDGEPADVDFERPESSDGLDEVGEYDEAGVYRERQHSPLEYTQRTQKKVNRRSRKRGSRSNGGPAAKVRS